MVTISQPPHKISPARSVSVRGARRVINSPASSASRAAGMNQETCEPKAVPNILVIPVAPPKPVFPPPVPPPFPAPPKIRLRPL
jgi:hypothetical protein